jgi:hypothetical protein
LGVCAEWWLVARVTGQERVHRKSTISGSSTACILSLDTVSSVLYSANIGDSGYVIFRDGQIIEESLALTHYFNCPYQLSNPPPGFNKSQVDRYLTDCHVCTYCCFTSLGGGNHGSEWGKVGLRYTQNRSEQTV